MRGGCDRASLPDRSRPPPHSQCIEGYGEGRLRSQRVAVSAAFFFFGTVAGSLVPRMPAFKESLHLTDGQVGLAFVVYAAGAVVGAVVARPILGGGARIWVRVLTVLLAGALITPALAPGFAAFAATFLVL